LQVQLAQWLSEDFSIQVSRWIRELLITGKVEIGKEKSSEELNKLQQQKIEQLSTKVELLNDDVMDRENTIIEQEEELEEKDAKIKNLQSKVTYISTESLRIQKTYQHLAKLHDKSVMRRQYHKFKKGSCFYSVKDKWRSKIFIKIGITDDINARLQTYRTSMPDIEIIFLVYLIDPLFLEKSMKIKFDKKLIQHNHEYLIDIPEDKFIEDVKAVIFILNLDVTYEENLSLYNDPYKIEEYEDNDEDNRNYSIESNSSDDERDLSDVKDKEELVQRDGKDEEYSDEECEEDHGDEECDHEECDDECDHAHSDDECDHEECDDECDHDHSDEEEHLIKEYKCDKCTMKPYTLFTYYKNHMKKIHGIIIPEETGGDGKTCLPCNRSFRDRGKLNRHIATVHNRSTKKKCKFCKKELSSRDALNWHIRNVHKKEFQVKCPYTDCNKIISSKGNLRKHIKDVHEKSQRVKCTYEDCNRILLNKNNLKQHIDKFHLKIEQKQCTICDKMLSNYTTYRYHMSSIHKIILADE